MQSDQVSANNQGAVSAIELYPAEEFADFQAPDRLKRTVKLTKSEVLDCRPHKQRSYFAKKAHITSGELTQNLKQILQLKR
jgi:hypothetical protein